MDYCSTFTKIPCAFSRLLREPSSEGQEWTSRPEDSQLPSQGSTSSLLTSTLVNPNDFPVWIITCSDALKRWLIRLFILSSFSRFCWKCRVPTYYVTILISTTLLHPACTWLAAQITRITENSFRNRPDFAKCYALLIQFKAIII